MILVSLKQLGDISFQIDEHLKTLEKLVCMGYSSRTNTRSVNNLRWELFSTKVAESEKLPPTEGSLRPHVARCQYIASVMKGYCKPKPVYDSWEAGWEVGEDGNITPILSTDLPAPKPVIELTKCSCRGQCLPGIRCMLVHTKFSTMYIHVQMQ